MALGQGQSCEQTGSYGTTMPARSRSTSTFWPVRRREFPAAKARLAMVSFDFAARSSYLTRRSSLSSRKRALPPGGQSLRNAALDSAIGEMRVEAAFAAIHAIEGHHQKLSDLFLIHERHVIADVNVPASMTWNHRHGKSRLFLPKHLGQCGENRQVPFTGCGICVRRETPDFRPDHVKRNRAYAHLPPHPTLLLPGTQPLKRNVGAKAQLAAFGVRQRRRKRAETPTAVERHLPCFGVVVSRRDAVANDPEREPLRVARKRILVEREHILRHRGREPLSSFRIEDFIH